MNNIYQYLEPWQVLYFLTMFAGVLIGVGSSYILNVFKNDKELEILNKRFAKMSREYAEEREKESTVILLGSEAIARIHSIGQEVLSKNMLFGESELNKFQSAFNKKFHDGKNKENKNLHIFIGRILNCLIEKGVIKNPKEALYKSIKVWEGKKWT